MTSSSLIFRWLWSIHGRPDGAEAAVLPPSAPYDRHDLEIGASALASDPSQHTDHGDALTANGSPAGHDGNRHSLT